MGETGTVDRNRPAEFHGFVAASGHRLFAVFDDPDPGERALATLQTEGSFGEDEPWVFFGTEGRRRLDALGVRHGIRGRVMRDVQLVMSDDRRYLRMIDQALADGCLVLAVHVHDATEADQLAGRLRDLSGHTFAYGTHLDFVPTTGHIW